MDNHLFFYQQVKRFCLSGIWVFHLFFTCNLFFIRKVYKVFDVCLVDIHTHYAYIKLAQKQVKQVMTLKNKYLTGETVVKKILNLVKNEA